YVNYRKRVDRDRLVARDLTVVAFVEAFLPMLDDIDSARAHGDLAEGTPFAAIVEKFEGVLEKFGWERYGTKGEPFDPTIHGAFLHSPSPEVTESTVGEVLQAGHRAGDPVTFPEAALGATVIVPTLDGGSVRVKVPAGTPSGRVLRVRGKGVTTAKGTG